MKLGQYKQIKLLGSGAYGSIYLIEDLSNQNTYALKKLNIDVD